MNIRLIYIYIYIRHSQQDRDIASLDNAAKCFGKPHTNFCVLLLMYAMHYDCFTLGVHFSLSDPEVGGHISYHKNSTTTSLTGE